MRFQSLGLVVCVLGGVFGAAGCNRTTVDGSVQDVRGVALPGVAVVAEGAEAQTLTDGLGHYSLSASAGITGIRLVKDGYTSGYLALEGASGRSITARMVALWPLPPGAGSYLVDEYRYRAMTVSEPKPYATEHGPVYGCRVMGAIEKAVQPDPLILCHKVPAYDVRLARLHSVKTTGPEGGFDVWVAEASIAVDAAPVDEPERYLVQIRTAEPLTPGVYAMHWGAFEGRASIEPRAFLFAVEDPSHPAAETPPVPESKPAKAPKKAPAPNASAIPPENVDTTAADAEAEAPPR